MGKTTISAKIIEAGNGLPSVGRLVYDSTNNVVYRIVDDNNGHISTNGPGMGNSIDAELEEAGDPSDYTQEEWDSEVSDCRVDLAEDDDDDDDLADVFKAKAEYGNDGITLEDWKNEVNPSQETASDACKIQK